MDDHTWDTPVQGYLAASQVWASFLLQSRTLPSCLLPFTPPLSCRRVLPYSRGACESFSLRWWRCSMAWRTGDFIAWCGCSCICECLMGEKVTPFGHCDTLCVLHIQVPVAVRRMCSTGNHMVLYLQDHYDFDFVMVSLRHWTLAHYCSSLTLGEHGQSS